MGSEVKLGIIGASLSGRLARQEQPLPGNEWTPEQWAEWQRWQCGTEGTC